MDAEAARIAQKAADVLRQSRLARQVRTPAAAPPSATALHCFASHSLGAWMSAPASRLRADAAVSGAP